MVKKTANEMKVMIVVPFGDDNDVMDIRNDVRVIYNREPYKSMTTFIDISLGLKNLSGIQRLRKIVSTMLNDADTIIVFANDWMNDRYCRIINMIAGSLSYHIVYDDDDASRGYGFNTIHFDIDNGSCADVKDAINALSHIPMHYDFACEETCGQYDDDPCIIMDCHSAIISSRRKADIMEDVDYIASHYDSELSEKDTSNLKFYKASEIDANNIHRYLVTIKAYGEDIIGILYTGRLDRKEFCNESLYDVGGFDSDDVDDPVKISSNLITNENRFAFIGTLVIEKYALDHLLNSYNDLYIDGTTVEWHIGNRIK